MTVFEESMSAYNEYIQAMAETSKGMSTEKNCTRCCFANMISTGTSRSLPYLPSGTWFSRRIS